MKFLRHFFSLRSKFLLRTPFSNILNLHSSLRARDLPIRVVIITHLTHHCLWFQKILNTWNPIGVSIKVPDKFLKIPHKKE